MKARSTSWTALCLRRTKEGTSSPASVALKPCRCRAPSCRGERDSWRFWLCQCRAASSLLYSANRRPHCWSYSLDCCQAMNLIAKHCDQWKFLHLKTKQMSGSTLIAMYCKSVHSCTTWRICRSATDHDTPGVVGRCAFCKLSDWCMSELICDTVSSKMC